MYFNRTKKIATGIHFPSIRLKHGKSHWSMLAKKTFPKHRALEHFDDFYQSVYGRRWPSMRIALLSEHKYVAMVNNFGDTNKTITELENQGAINLRSIYNLTKENIKSQKKQTDKQQQLDKIYKMDAKMERFLSKQQESEVSSVYGATNSETPPDTLLNSLKSDSPISGKTEQTKIEQFETDQTSFNASDHSLTKQLADADLDDRRLIGPNQGVGGLHEFIPATKLKGMEDWVLESQHYQYYQKPSDFPVSVESDTEFSIPETVQIYTYERGNISTYKPPKKCTTGVLSHYLLDGASILPVLALDLQPGDKVLDACAAPGGKSLMMLQTLYPDAVVCNDIMESRVKRLQQVFHQYLYDFDTKWKGKCVLTQQDARVISDIDMYDKVLVDVPCTTDRHVLHNDDNNIFKPSRTKERLKLPEMQAQILSNCLRLVKPGGTLVYSTCSLSPIQNDGVVHLALRQAFELYNIEAQVKNLTSAVEPLREVYRFGTQLGLRYGQLVVPFLPSNFGPLYFSKIKRTK